MTVKLAIVKEEQPLTSLSASVAQFMSNIAQSSSSSRDHSSTLQAIANYDDGDELAPASTAKRMCSSLLLIIVIILIIVCAATFALPLDHEYARRVAIEEPDKCGFVIRRAIRSFYVPWRQMGNATMMVQKFVEMKIAEYVRE
jgi:hypothetical protein